MLGKPCHLASEGRAEMPWEAVAKDEGLKNQRMINIEKFIS